MKQQRLRPGRFDFEIDVIEGGKLALCLRGKKRYIINNLNLNKILLLQDTIILCWFKTSSV